MKFAIFWGFSSFSRKFVICFSICFSIFRTRSSPYETSTVSQSVTKVLIFPIISFFCFFFCIKLAFNKSRKVTKPDFRKKNLGVLKFEFCVKISHFWRFFGFFSKIWHLFLDFFVENARTNRCWSSCENRMAKIKSVLELGALQGLKFWNSEIFGLDPIFFKKIFFAFLDSESLNSRKKAIKKYFFETSSLTHLGPQT